MFEEGWLNVDPALDFKAPELRRMLALWEEKRGARSMPSRADFPPEVLRGHLGWIVLIDVQPEPLRFRYRLVGSGVTGRIGRDSTGRYLDELYPPDIYENAISAFRVMLRTHRPVRAYGFLEHAERGHLPFEAIDMPLSDDDRTVNMIMTRGKM